MMKVTTTKDLETEFIEIPTGPGKHHEPMIRGKGPKVCLIASYVKYYDKTPEELQEFWSVSLTLEEVQAALDFAEKYPYLIDWERYAPEEDD